MVDFPVSIATAQSIEISYLVQGLILQVAWCIIMYSIGKIVYTFGVRLYEAFGA